MNEKIFQQITKRLDQHEKRISAVELLLLGDKKGNTPPERKNTKLLSKIEFKKNPRAFFKQYTKSMAGPQKFVLVVAFLTKGKLDINVTFNEIEKTWNKNSGLLGAKLTSRTYGTRAKEKEWIDSTKYGIYKLTKKWAEIFS